MKKNLLLLMIIALGLFTVNKSFAQISLTAIDVAYTQNFDLIFCPSGTIAADVSLSDNSSAFPGFYSFRTVDNTQPQVFQRYVTTNTSGKFYHFGNSTSPERAVGVINATATGPIYFGLRFVNNTGVEIKALVISFYGEEWRSGSGGQGIALNELSFDYLQGGTVSDLTTGSYTAVGDLKFAAPFVGPVTSPLTLAVTLDGNNASYRTLKTATVSVTIPVGEEIMLRWSDVTDDPSYDSALAIDDLSVTPTILSDAHNPIKKSGMSVYPNPVIDVLNIESYTNEVTSMEIYDMTGRRVKSGLLDSENTAMNVTSLPKGLYIVKVKGSGNIITSKFIKN